MKKDYGAARLYAFVKFSSVLIILNDLPANNTTLPFYSWPQIRRFPAKIAHNPTSFCTPYKLQMDQEAASASAPASVASCKSLNFEGCSVVNATKATACIPFGTDVVPDPALSTITGV